MHEVMEGCREVVSLELGTLLLAFFHMDKRGFGYAKVILDTEYGLRYFLFQKHGSTRVFGHFFIEGRGFCDLKVNAGNDKCWVWSARDRSKGDDTETVVRAAFPSSKPALQFKVVFDEARVLKRERLSI